MSDNRLQTKIIVLLIGGYPGDQKLIKHMLPSMQVASIERECAGNIRDVLEYLSKKRPHLIIMSFPFPASKETDTLFQIREMTRFAPVLVLAGPEDEEMGIEAMRAGAQDILDKEKINGDALERCIRYSIERKMVETKFLKSEERFSKLVEQNSDGMILVNREGIVVFANPAMQSFTGIDSRELTGAPFGFPLISRNTAEIDFFHKQKGPIVSEMRVVELEWEGNMVYLASLRDITKRKNAEIALKESQARLIETAKIGALGTLVAGVAHELNNPLMGMLNYAQYCLKHTPKASKLFSVLEDMIQETGRCTNIVKNLLTFSRMDTTGIGIHRKIHCSIILDRVINLLTYRYKEENVSIKRSGESDLPEIRANESNLQQVFLNLITNALDALADVKDKVIHIRAFKETDTIRIDISDNGCGIEKEYLASIFDPFFTTKPPGKGTGLGLSMSRSIVEAHNGNLICESMPGKGTTFKVRLPLDC